MSKEPLYFNPNKLFTMGATLYAIVANRGYGKTYSMKKWCINRFIKKGEMFIYLKRYDTDLTEKDTFFDSMNEEFPNVEFKVKGKVLFINKQKCGYIFPLSMWQSLKSIEFPDVTTIIYDEFIKEKDMKQYLPNEVNALLSLADTVFRNRSGNRIVCLGNAITLANPLFLYFKLTPNPNTQEIYRKGDIVVHIPNHEKFANYREKTQVGSLVKDVEYGKMALYNEWKETGDLFIAKRYVDSRLLQNIKYKGVTYGIWFSKNAELIYLSYKHNPTLTTIVMSRDEMTDNCIYVERFRANYVTHKFGEAFLNGQLRFENSTLRSIGYDILGGLKVQ